jgi:hypothetical protein
LAAIIEWPWSAAIAVSKRGTGTMYDGTNFKVQRRGATKAEPSLVVLGIDENNYRSILAIEPGTKDNCDS